MKKIILFITVSLLYILFNNITVYGKINLNLKKNEIAIIFIQDNIMVSNTTNTLLLLNNIDNRVEKFSDLNVININNIPMIFNYKNTYIIKNTSMIDNILYKLEQNLIKIKSNDYTFCIYNNVNSNISNTYGCNFLYLFNTKDIDIIETDEDIDIIFFNEKLQIPTYFLEDIYSKWIDIYKLNETDIVVLKIIEDDYQILVIPNNR